MIDILYEEAVVLDYDVFDELSEESLNVADFSNFLETHEMNDNLYKDLDIVEYGEFDDFLRKKSESISKIDQKTHNLVHSMRNVMHNASGIGLAAIQVGYPIRLFLVGEVPEITDMNDKWYSHDEELFVQGYQNTSDKVNVFINPKITFYSPEKVPYDEGCLSLPGFSATVVRPKFINVEYTDLAGNKNELKAYGLLGVCIQHEYDHLNGKLYIDHVEAKERERIITEIKTYQSQGISR